MKQEIVKKEPMESKELEQWAAKLSYSLQVFHSYGKMKVDWIIRDSQAHEFYIKNTFFLFLLCPI